MIHRSIFFVLSFLIIWSSVSAETPQIISFQGKVTESGSPVADGTYNMRFRIYNVPTGGSELWNSGVQSVPVTDGIFNVLLGESPMPILDLPFDEDYWLLVTFEGINQTPRQRLVSVSYAYMASGLVAGTEVVGSVTSGTAAAIKGTNTDTASTSYGVYGVSSSFWGRGVFGWASATLGSNYGVQGSSYSPDGCGVFGLAYATYGPTYGVYGSSYSTDGRGVYGSATTPSGNTYGVYGESSSTWGSGVYGIATATSGTNYGVYGLSHSTDGLGVYGLAAAFSGSNYGVYGESGSISGTGVYGVVGATAGTTYGVYGHSRSSSGRGVYGWASQSTGNGQGVRGESDSSTNGVGVYGLGSSTTGLNYGVFGRTFSSDGYGVYGTGVAPGYALYAAGDFAASGTKSCVVKTSRGPTLMYCQESPENWFEDFGEGKLVNGRCHIDLDPLFLETVTINSENPLKVFVEHRGPCQGTYIETRETGFDVIEQNSGTSDVGFCYRVVAKRKGFESKRLDYCKAAETDSYLYPELRENELKE